MGYNSYFHGDVYIDPPLSRDQVELFAERTSAFIGGDAFTGSYGYFGISGSGDEILIPEDDCKWYEFEEDCHLIVQTIKDISGSSVRGMIIREGEEQGDMVRARFLDGFVKIEQAKMVWPGGEEVPTHGL